MISLKNSEKSMDTPLPFRVASRALLAGTYHECAWCGEPIKGNNFDRHHWCVKRGQLPKSRFDDIDLVINVVPLHKKCHRQYGQTLQMYERCHSYVEGIFGSKNIEIFKEKVYDNYIEK